MTNQELDQIEGTQTIVKYNCSLVTSQKLSYHTKYGCSSNSYILCSGGFGLMTSEKTVDKNHELILKELVDEAKRLKSELKKNNNSMKLVIIKIAENLEIEEKVPLYEISSLTAKILIGIVTERYVTKCLDNKYKNIIRSNNAKQQNKIKSINITSQPVLAEPVPLNPETEEKKTISISKDDQITFESAGDKLRPNPKEISMIDIDLVKSSPLQTVDESGKKLNDLNKNNLIKNPINSAQQEEIRQLREALRKSIHSKSTNKIEKDSENDVHIVEGEFSMIFDRMQKYLADIFPKIGSHGDVWQKFSYDLEKKAVIHSDFGRLGEENKDDEEDV